MRPVIQTADVAVKRAFIPPILSLLTVAIGVFSRNVPIIIIISYTNDKYCVGENSFLIRFFAKDYVASSIKCF